MIERATSPVRHIPPWMPGASLMRRAQEVKAMVDRVIDEPFNQSVEEKVGFRLSHKAFVSPLTLDVEEPRKRGFVFC